MKMKLTSLMFGLLLAVGWTSNASAQLKAEYSAKEYSKSLLSPASKAKSGPVTKQDLKKAPQTPLLLNAGNSLNFLFAQPTETQDVLKRAPRRRAPRRAQYDITADKTMTRAEYEAITYDWVDANGTNHPGTKLTEPASNPYQIAYLLGSTYMNQEIPGIKYSAFYDQDHPYPNIEFGWDIPGNVRWSNIPSGTSTTTTTTNTWSWAGATDGTTLPTDWTLSTNNSLQANGDGTWYLGGQTSTRSITIPASVLADYTINSVVIRAKIDDGYSGKTISVNGVSQTLTNTLADYTWTNVDASNGIVIEPTDGYVGFASITINGTKTTGPTGGGLTIGAYGLVLFSSITVYDQNNNVLTSWDPNTAINNSEYSSYTQDGSTYYYFTIPGWNCSYIMNYISASNNNYGYLYGNHINIPASYFNGTSSIRVVVNGLTLDDYEGTIVVNGEEKPVTTSATNYTWTFSDINTPSGSVIPPDDNGYTVFLVKVKDNAGDPTPFTYSWNNGMSSLINFFDTYIDEVQLLTDGTRLNEDSDDAGTMFAYSGDLNKFYFISKGANYWFGSSEADYWPHYGPTYDMYEEFSPTTTESGDQITDFYSKLLYGNSYNVIHDCRGVNVMQHYFSMSGNEGTDHRSMTNLIFWIPDHRGQQNNQNNYDEEYLPHVGLYTITLEAEAQPAADYSATNRMYDVTCEWVSSLNTILDFDVDQDYELWVYVYDDQGNPVADYKVTDLIVDENGIIHNTTSHTYQVEQLATTQHIVYRVKGWPKDAGNTPGHYPDDPEKGNFYVLSNLDPVLIPGYNNFLSLGVQHYECDFSLDNEHNYYRNFLTVDNQNPDNALTASRIEDGEDLYTLYRYDATAEEPVYTKAADLLFSVDNNKVEYLIDYANQYYIDEANLYNEYSNANISGYTDPDALGYPTHGEIANISQGGGVVPVTIDQYEMVTSTSSLTDGEYLIVYEGSNRAFNGGLSSLDATSNYISVTPNNGIIESNATTDAATFTIAASGNGYTIKSKSGYYIGRTSNSNGITTSTTTAMVNSITFSDNNAVISSSYSNSWGTTYTRYLKYNTSDNRFRYYSSTSGNTQYVQLYKHVTSGSGGFELLTDYLDNSTYTQVGQVVFDLPWKSIQVKLQDESAGTSSGYFLIQNNGKLRFVMPAGYNNANLRFVIHNAPVTSNYYDGTFTLSSSTGDTQTITIQNGSSVYGDRDYEAIFTGISTGDVITITGTHTVGGTLYNYSPDFKYIHVYVQGGDDGISENTPLNLAAIRFVDQFKDDTSKDKHPTRYGYVLKYEPTDGVHNPQESARPEIPVQHTGAVTNGYYSLSEIDGDMNIGRVVDGQILHDQGITMNMMNAEVNMNLTANPQVYYFTLERKPSTDPDASYEEISELQRREDDTYQEMDNILSDYQATYNAVTTPRFDNYNVQTGQFNDYMSYVPIVWTHGEQQDNRRIKWNTENRHNSYGAPIWKTGVGDVVLNNATAEKQQGWNTTWMDGDTKCRLYMLDDIEAWGYLPTVSNVEYEPYMFRVFVESKHGKLRKFKYDTVTDEEGKTHEVIAADVTSDEQKQAPLCVWSAYVNLNGDETLEALNTACSNVFTEGNDGTFDYLQFNKDKVDRTAGYDENGNPLGDWDKDEMNAIFGVVDDLKTIVENGKEVIDPDDLTIFVRFYYIVEGMSLGWTPWNPSRTAAGDAPAGYGAESPGFSPGPATGVNEVQYLGEIVSQTYYNVQGMVSDKPFNGVNIVVTRFSNGTTSVSKVVR